MFNFFSKSPTVRAWASHHIDAVAGDVAAGRLSKSVLYNRTAIARHINHHLGDMRLDTVRPPDVMRMIRAIQDQGLANTAQAARRMLMRLHYEAIEAGVAPADCNPAKAIRSPAAPVQRSRLTLPEWLAMLAESEHGPYPYLYRAMLLAVITGQRRGDLIKMRFEHITDGHLRVEQQKTGARVAIPLALRCDAIGWALADVIDLCRDSSGSPYLLHTSIPPTRDIDASLLTGRFCALRRAVCGAWQGEGTPPTFHEQRSLAERLYSDQGIDTRKLLGHRRQSMTDVYNNSRRLREWVSVPL